MKTDATRFVHESDAYRLLTQAGIRVPAYGVVRDAADIDALPFAEGAPVVIKAAARDLWHKSDAGGLVFTTFSRATIGGEIDRMRTRVTKAGYHTWIEALVCERAAVVTREALPLEAFFSIQNDPACGWTICAGVGGVHTEFWNKALSRNMGVWPTSAMAPETAAREFMDSVIGTLWSQTLRSKEPVVSEQTIHDFFAALWKLPEILAPARVTLLELNPVAVAESKSDGGAGGTLIALDALATAAADAAATDTVRATAGVGARRPGALLHPRRVGIVGVSEQAGAMGRIILENILRASMDPGDIVIIKPKAESVMGLPCVPDVSALKERAVDLLIIALPAPLTLDIISRLCAQDGGAEYVYVVASGFDDGADTNGNGRALRSLLAQRRQNGQWTPAVIGPNGLGMILAPARLNTLFIPRDKMEISFDRPSETALISQSGAFMITCLSHEDGLSFKYGMSIGNQIDMRVSNFLDILSHDKAITNVGIYAEGFAPRDARACAECVRALKDRGVNVVIYKGGREAAGMKAAASHTGAMVHDTRIVERLMTASGALWAPTIPRFRSFMKWVTAYPKFDPRGTVAVIANAGFETVESADCLSQGESRRHLRPYALTETDKARLDAVLTSHRLNGLTQPALPLDITPTADEKAWLACVTCVTESAADVIVLGIIPLTPRLDTADPAAADAMARELARISAQTGKAIGVTVNAGAQYDAYRAAFSAYGLPVFTSMEEALV